MVVTREAGVEFRRCVGGCGGSGSGVDCRLVIVCIRINNEIINF